MKRFTIWRRTIQAETYEVEAETLEEAIEELNNGCHDPKDTEFIDWLDDWQFEGAEELEPLYQMVKNYRCDTTS
jgi:ferritin